MKKGVTSMNKVLVIPDLHGKDVWKRAVNEIEHDKVVFLGDYFDSFDIDGNTQLENFSDIVEFKTANQNSAILLVGNHDLYYLTLYKCSGYQEVFGPQITQALNQAYSEQLLQDCYSDGNFLYVHAGLTNTWLKANTQESYDSASSINSAFYKDPTLFNFISGGDMYGNDVYQSPAWVRPEALIKDMYKGLKQIVGHTRVPQIAKVPFVDVIFTDCLDKRDQFLTVQDGITKIINL